MKTKKRFLLPIVCVIALAMVFTFAALALTACGDTPAEKTVTAISIDETASVEQGMTVKVNVTITYDDGTTSTRGTDIETWKSSDEAIATVSQTGTVRGVAKGTVTITASVGEISDTCQVTVTAGRTISIVDENGTAITEAISLEKDATKQLKAKVMREDQELTDQTIVWESADPTKVHVSETGLVTAYLDTEEPVAVTATIQNTEISASVDVNVTWTGKDQYNFGSTYEQNKSPAQMWNYWGDKTEYGQWTNTTIFSAYVDPNYEAQNPADEGYNYIGANKATIEFHVDNPEANVASIQLFFRSAGTQGKLLTNHNYEVKLKLETSASGVVSLNDYSKSEPAPDEIVGTSEDHEKEVTAGQVNEITVKFRHGDTGAIYAQGVYTNIESAIHLCLGKLGGDRVTVSVYGVQYKDLGESTSKWADDPTSLEGYQDPDAPVLPAVPAEVKPVGAITPTGARIVAGTDDLEGKALFEITGTIDTATYFEGDDEAANDWLKACYFDAQESGGNWRLYRFTVVSSSVTEGAFTIQYDITRLNPISGASSPAYSCHFVEKEASEGGYNDNHYRDLKLTTEQATHGQTITVGTKKYTLYNEQIAEEAHNWGCVSILIENVEAE